MRASLFLFLIISTLGLLFWVSLSGVLISVGLVLLIVFIVITVGYPDTMLLFLLGARELRSSDEKNFFEAASQEAYKLAVPMPRLYFYDGTMERAFVFQRGPFISLILNKTLLENSTVYELRAISFELLLQVKKGMASKRTKCTFILGFLTWLIHSLLDIILRLVPSKDFRKSAEWFFSYLLSPGLDLIFKLTMGENYFRKLDQLLDEYPNEKSLLRNVGLKIRRPYSYYSLPSRKILELHAASKSRHYQNIMTLEFLPHEWDYLFHGPETNIVK